MTKLLAILASLSLISTDAFMHNPSITETKITLNYKDTPDIEIKPEINDKVHGGGLWWKEMQYQRAAECALDETVECDIDELFALSKGKLEYSSFSLVLSFTTPEARIFCSLCRVFF